MKVLIIGGTKFVGREITRQTLGAGHEVVLFNRGQTDKPSDIETIHGDIEDFASFKTQIGKMGFDVAVHCIAYTEKHSHDLVQVFKRTNTKLVVLGSVECYEAFQQLARGKEVADMPISEQDPVSSIEYYLRGAVHEFGEDYDKNLMTRVLTTAADKREIDLTVFRLPKVYGPRDYQYAGRHGPIIRRIIDERHRLLTSHLDQAAISTYGYNENIAAAVVHSYDQPVTLGKIYNIGETRVRTLRRWADLYGQAADWEFEHIAVPDEILRGDKRQMNRPPRNLIFDCTRYISDTAFVPPVSLEDGIAATLQWAREHPDVLGPKPDYDTEDAIIAKYAEFVTANVS